MYQRNPPQLVDYSITASDESASYDSVSLPKPLCQNKENFQPSSTSTPVKVRRSQDTSEDTEDTDIQDHPDEVPASRKNLREQDFQPERCVCELREITSKSLVAEASKFVPTVSNMMHGKLTGCLSHEKFLKLPCGTRGESLPRLVQSKSNNMLLTPRAR